MNTYELIKTLVDLVGDYRDAHPSQGQDLGAFLAWVASKEATLPEPETLHITGFSIEAELAAYIGRLSRYANTYIKTTLEGLPFSTDMEFAFTALLHGAGEVGKTDLIRMMAFDRSSGMGVIRRLLEKGIIEEFPNPEDKRGKLLRLTEKGQKAVQLGYQKVPQAANLVSKNLNPKEKIQLLQLLKKLDDFHYPIYLSEKKGKDLFE
ncbi:MAG: winged helix DNA-binding protein [Bacteroidota bacterium]